MRFSVITILLFRVALAAPILRRQLAGEGSACNSIFTSTDNGVGYGVENAEDNTATNIGSLNHRQLHGEGEACDSILTQTDNGVGYGTENAEDNVASNIAGVTGHQATSNQGSGTSTGGNAPAAGPKPGPGGGPGKGPGGQPGHRRQLDKIANGFGAIGESAGVGSMSDPEVTQLDNLAGTLTDGAANIGSDFGNMEVETLESTGKAVPRKRQLDKIANGFANVGHALGADKVSSPLASSADQLDGTLTDGAADLGAGVANSEEEMLVGAGESVPVIF